MLFAWQNYIISWLLVCNIQGQSGKYNHWTKRHCHNEPFPNLNSSLLHKHTVQYTWDWLFCTCNVLCKSSCSHNESTQGRFPVLVAKLSRGVSTTFPLLPFPIPIVQGMGGWAVCLNIDPRCKSLHMLLWGYAARETLSLVGCFPAACLHKQTNCVWLHWRCGSHLFCHRARRRTVQVHWRCLELKEMVALSSWWRNL